MELTHTAVFFFEVHVNHGHEDDPLPLKPRWATLQGVTSHKLNNHLEFNFFICKLE